MKLYKKEIMCLPSSTEITVIWSGGNGPHKYIYDCNSFYGFPVAIGRFNQIVGWLDQIGDYPQTQVWSFLDE